MYLARTPRASGSPADTVAVKVLSLTGTDGFDALADELSLFAGLRSPRLVPMYDVGIDAGAVFYAMRHEPLGSLAAPARDLTRRERLRRSPGPPAARTTCTRPALVHRGIAPANILLDQAGAVLAEPAVAHLLTQGTRSAASGPRRGPIGWSSSTRSS